MAQIYDKLSQAYQQALGRYYTQRYEAQQGFGEAEKPISEAVSLFQPGGAYGAVQLATIESEAKKGYASGLSNLVSTGMSSGTNTAGLRARITADTTKAKLGVEDVRIGKLAEAFSLLSNFRATKTGTLASIQGPDIGSYLGALTSAYNTQTGAQTAQQGQFLDYILGKSRIRSNEKIANTQLESRPVETQHFNTPW